MNWSGDRPDALVQRSQLGHQLGRSLVLIAAEVVDRLDGLGRGLELVFVDVDTLVLGKHQSETSGRTESQQDFSQKTSQ